MKLLLIGANGYLGARLYFDLKEKFAVVGTYHKDQSCRDFIQLDVTDEGRVRAVIKQVRPDYIIQTANYPSPRFATDNETAYKKLNLLSTKHIVSAADDVNALVIFISSFAALDPNNIYGELKLKSEKIVSMTKAGYLILRPSLILGFSPNIHNDRPFDRVLRCLDQKTVGEFDTSWRFQPTYIGHLSQIIKACIDKNIMNRTIHVFCPSVQTQYSTAKDILKPFGVKVVPVDKHLNMPLQKRREKELSELELPVCNYNKMISSIHKEIRNRNTFSFPAK